MALIRLTFAGPEMAGLHPDAPTLTVEGLARLDLDRFVPIHEDPTPLAAVVPLLLARGAPRAFGKWRPGPEDTPPETRCARHGEQSPTHSEGRHLPTGAQV